MARSCPQLHGWILRTFLQRSAVETRRSRANLTRPPLGKTRFGGGRIEGLVANNFRGCGREMSPHAPTWLRLLTWSAGDERQPDHWDANTLLSDRASPDLPVFTTGATRRYSYSLAHESTRAWKS